MISSYSICFYGNKGRYAFIFSHLFHITASQKGFINRGLTHAEDLVTRLYDMISKLSQMDE